MARFALVLAHYRTTDKLPKRFIAGAPGQDDRTALQGSRQDMEILDRMLGLKLLDFAIFCRGPATPTGRQAGAGQLHRRRWDAEKARHALEDRCQARGGRVL